MSISVSDELQLFAQEIHGLLSPNILRDFARDVGFVQRTSKYQAKDLVALCVWMSQNVATTSLTQLSSCLEASTEVLISPEGLNQRFNAAAVQFLQQVLAKLLNQKLSSSRLCSSPYTSIFKSIRILDSTAFQLPDVFSSVYPGAGVKEYINLLGAIYTQLSLERSKDQIIKEFGEGNESFRDQSHVFKFAGISDAKSAYRPNKEQQATLNDVIMTAYFRALSHFTVYAEPRTAEKMIGLTIDLRRYLPNYTTGAICNLSGMEMPVIKMEDDESFKQTLVRIKQSMDKIKSQNPGLSSAAGMELLAGMKLSVVKEMYNQQYEQALQMGMALPLLINFGVIADEPIQFGEVQAEDGYMTSPIMYAPFFSMGASFYNGRLTFTIGYHTPDTSKEKVDKFLESVVNQLS